MNPFDQLLDEMFNHLDRIGRTNISVCRAVGISAKHLSAIRQNRADPSLALLRRLWVEIMGEG